jgi:hypothetical protein
VATNDPETAFKILKHAALKDPIIESNHCHFLTHAIGQASAVKYKTFAETNAHADEYCSYGYHHGMYETLVATMGKDVFIKNVNTFCESVPGKERRSFEYFTCIHGIGHGTTLLTYYELPEALKLCDAFSGTWEQEECYNGAFMQNLFSDKDHPTEYVRADDSMFPCTAIAEKYRTECFNRQARVFLLHNNYDFSIAFSMCASLDVTYRNRCYEGLGREAFAISYNNIETTRGACSQGETADQKQACYLDAVEYFIDFTHKRDSGDAFCKALEPTMQNACISKVTEYIKIF